MGEVAGRGWQERAERVHERIRRMVMDFYAEGVFTANPGGNGKILDRNIEPIGLVYCVCRAFV